MGFRIGSNLSALFNPSRIGQTPDIDRTSGVDKAGQSQASGRQGQDGGAGQYVSREHGGVVQTRVADVNNFKKAQLDGSRANIESMADRLYDKLPNILADMKKLPGEGDSRTEAGRVAVNERNAAAVADSQAAREQEQLVNFSL